MFKRNKINLYAMASSSVASFGAVLWLILYLGFKNSTINVSMLIFVSLTWIASVVVSFFQFTRTDAIDRKQSFNFTEVMYNSDY